jgi:hypothetical protein
MFADWQPTESDDVWTPAAEQSQSEEPQAAQQLVVPR